MWLVVSFDIPSDHAKDYRQMRKTLISNGFDFIQKSICWRWTSSYEKFDSLQRKIAGLSPPGSLMILALPDQSFLRTGLWQDGKEIPVPDPPEPWTVI